MTVWGNCSESVPRWFNTVKNKIGVKMIYDNYSDENGVEEPFLAVKRHSRDYELQNNAFEPSYLRTETFSLSSFFILITVFPMSYSFQAYQEIEQEAALNTAKEFLVFYNLLSLLILGASLYTQFVLLSSKDFTNYNLFFGFEFKILCWLLSFAKFAFFCMLLNSYSDFKEEYFDELEGFKLAFLLIAFIGCLDIWFIIGAFTVYLLIPLLCYLVAILSDGLKMKPKTYSEGSNN